jgi:hypothetical protein
LGRGFALAACNLFLTHTDSVLFFGIVIFFIPGLLQVVPPYGSNVLQVVPPYGSNVLQALAMPL